ncbi:MAG: FKBP-type peptidyl-prolyl cis-trans isomerase [Patescibacteria group bacterium]|jgi:FKBP-type peptidyl-prolyl cis-trans isomerase
MKNVFKITTIILSLVLISGCASTTTTSSNTNINVNKSTTKNMNANVNISSGEFSSGLQLPITDMSTLTTTTSGLKYKDLTVGTSTDTAKAGDNVVMDYTGMLPDGTKFDSSLDRGQAFTFTLGVGQVIAGWDEGVAGMKIGQERILVIPSELGYGSMGAGAAIPPNATLQFQVRLNAIQ